MLFAGEQNAIKILSYNNANTTFKIPIPPLQTITMLAKFRNIEKTLTLPYHFYFRTETEVLKEIIVAYNYNQGRSIFNLLFVGALSILALFFLAQFLQQRTQWVYLVYVCYLVCTVLHALRDCSRHTDFAGWQTFFQYWYYNGEAPLSFGIYIFYISFFVLLLDIKQHNKIAFIYSKVLIAALIISIVLDIYLKLFYSIHTSYLAFYFLRMPLLILTMPIMFLSYKSKAVAAKYFFYGSLALVIGVLFNFVMSSLQRTGNYNYLFDGVGEASFWKNYIIYSRIGMLIEALFFSLGLAHKAKLEYTSATNDALKSNLSNMINHAISNALNKLKGMIKRKEESTLQFIDTTGAMMENMLTGIRNQITLTQEITMAQKFFDFRNDSIDGIGFLIKNENCNTENYIVPPMLLQPFIENCIEHAWDENNEDKQIILKIIENEKTASIEIMDNGRGIIKYEKTDNSQGMYLIAERIKYFNAIFGCNIIYEIKNAKNIKGTIVTIKNIPKKK